MAIHRIPFVVAGIMLLSAEASRAAEPDGKVLVAFPESATVWTVLQENQAFLDLRFQGWGPNWAWMEFEGKVEEKDGGSLLAAAGKVPGSGAELKLTVRGRKTGPRRLELDAELRTSKDTDLTIVAAAVELSGKGFEKGKVVATAAGGGSREVDLPLAMKGLGESVRRFEAVDAGGGRTVFSLDPPRNVPSDGAARIIIAEGALKAADPARVAIAIDFPADLTLYLGAARVPSEGGSEGWYEFRPGADLVRPSEIGLEEWLEAPAGKHGRIQRKADALLYDGKPIKLWGLNLCYGNCAPEKDLAERRARFYAKFGINAVRLHKFADGPGWSGIQSARSCVEFDPAALDRMDYQVAKLKERGIYVLLSAHFGSLQLGPDDRRIVPYLEEFGKFDGRKDRVSTPHSAIHYSPELQDAHIRQTVNLLRHRNRYTGSTYAEDPAVAFIEIINEQSILFYSSMSPLKASPTLRRQVAGRFSDWLRAKYGSHEKLLQAWGPKAFDGFEHDGFASAGERLDKRNILPLGNPWYWDPDQLRGSQAFRRRRLLDTLRFLYELQNEFYDRYVKAVREAGYAGEIVGSNWQAGRAFSHFYNLYSDARVGAVDRHNYFGGGDGGRIDDATMLAAPGSGILGSGLQQVADRPFMLSEWIHVTPNEWGVEGPAIIGAYGMGLQGWDVSFMFQNGDSGGFSGKIGRDRWDVTAPNVLGVFPAVARQVLRDDVAESKALAPRYVHVGSLDEGKLGFEDRVAQQGDVKAFGGGAVPASALAVARCVVEFTDSYRDTPAFELSRFVRNDRIESSTGELRWKPGRSRLDGFFTVDTRATKGVVGFAEGLRCDLGAVTIEPLSRFAAVYVTAKERDRDIETSRRLLVVAVARARNKGMKVLGDERILEPGKGPVVMEPVKARIAIRKAGAPAVLLLDHDGRRTDRTLPVRDGAFEIDGARDATPYYLVLYPD